MIKRIPGFITRGWRSQVERKNSCIIKWQENCVIYRRRNAIPLYSYESPATWIFGWFFICLYYTNMYGAITQDCLHVVYLGILYVPQYPNAYRRRQICFRCARCVYVFNNWRDRFFFTCCDFAQCGYKFRFQWNTGLMTGQRYGQFFHFIFFPLSGNLTLRDRHRHMFASCLMSGYPA